LAQTTDPGFRDEAPARALALLLAAHGPLGAEEWHELERVGAFRRLGISTVRFRELLQHCAADVGGSLHDRSWLRAEEADYVNAVLDAVTDPAARLLVLQLSMAAITADGRISRDERMVYLHCQARWGISPQRVMQALVADSAFH